MKSSEAQLQQDGPSEDSTEDCENTGSVVSWLCDLYHGHFPHFLCNTSQNQQSSLTSTTTPATTNLPFQLEQSHHFNQGQIFAVSSK
ncbi:hypothetical protein M8J77_008865 [Diaphorina citri]|nr:hypothetical protein M8J77_008865 [Diaphorina citri]